MFKTPHREDAPLEALAATITALARTGPTRPDADPAEPVAIDLFKAPLVVATRAEREPLAASALRLAQSRGRAIVAVMAELRGRMPRFEFAIGLPGEMCNSYPGYEAWLPMEGPGLWLVSAFTPHPAVPVFHLATDELAHHGCPPWSGEQDRTLGLRHATIALARLLGDAA